MPGFDGISRKLSNELHAKFFAPKEAVKSEGTKETKPAVPVGQQGNTKEVGDDLLDPRLFANALGFMGKTPSLNKADQADIDTLNALAGINAKPVTEAQYKSVEKSTQLISANFDKLNVTNNAEKLFASQGQVLDDVFAKEFNLG